MAETGVRGRPAALDGLRVLVTRPRHQSGGLAALIEARGGVPIRFPALEILPARDPDAARAALAHLAEGALAIFVSPNAVEHGLALLGGAGIPGGVAAVGEGTAAALEAAGLGPVLRPPSGAGSEGLLALPELDRGAVAGTRIVIVRGEGGRPLLGDTLSKRGARVAYAEVYRRAGPRDDPAEVAERGAAGGIDAIVVTSVAGLENLFAVFGDAGSGWLREAGYVVASERLARHARAFGIAQAPLVAAGADDEALLEALMEWRATHPDARS